MTDEAHSKWSPSSFHRRMLCPGSMALESAAPNTSSKYADEGTAAHALAEHCLRHGKEATDYIGWRLRQIDEGMPVDHLADADFCEHVQTYIDDVRRRAEGKTLMIEQRVHFGDWLGVPDEEAFGTADAVILGDDDLTIVDLKFGMGVKVDVCDPGAPGATLHTFLNPQLMLYALGCLYEYELLGEFKTVTMVINQPRLGHLDEVTVDVRELHQFAIAARETVAKVKSAMREPTLTQVDGATPQFLTPGEKQCKFCRAKATCPALAAEVLEHVGGHDFVVDNFEALTIDTQTPAKDHRPHELASAMGAVDLIEDWCKAVRAETERRLFAGEDVPGFMLAEGKRGARQWIDEQVAKAAGLTETKEVVITPTQAEKVLKKDPARWAELQSNIAQKPGRPSVVAVSEGKAPYSPQETTAAAFTDLSASAGGHPFRD